MKLNMANSRILYSNISKYNNEVYIRIHVVYVFIQNKYSCYCGFIYFLYGLVGYCAVYSIRIQWNLT